MNITKAQAQVFASPLAMQIIVDEAKETLATTFEISFQRVGELIGERNETIFGAMRKLVSKGVDAAVEAANLEA